MLTETVPPDIITALVTALITLITALSGYITYRTKTNTTKITAIESAVLGQVQATAIVDPASQVVGQWSADAKEAMQKAIPPGAEVVKIDDAPTYHIVYWRMRTI